MSKKVKMKASKGFVDYFGRQADFIPSVLPKLGLIMNDALIRTTGIDFGEVEILETVEAPKDGMMFLFVTMKQVGTNDPITFSIPTQQIITTLGKGSYLHSVARTVRHYRVAKKYKILPAPKPAPQFESALGSAVQSHVVSKVDREIEALQ